MAKFLETLIEASEKAAFVARSCCSACSKEALFIAEKFEAGNPRFEKDFKTIADVLGQEAARTLIEARYPDLVDQVRGEEIAELGGVEVTLQKTPAQTAHMLNSIVPPGPAKHMAEAAHRQLEEGKFKNLVTGIPDEIDTSDLGVWIDPIDATAEFISGIREEAPQGRGLPCVTVLVGAFRLSTGEPIMGVINQPFHPKKKMRILWGYCDGEIKKWGGTETESTPLPRTVFLSEAEKPEIKNIIKKAGWTTKSAPGAGNKLMRLLLGEASAYVVSEGTTYVWDTCGPHAILRARGGDMLTFDTFEPITYNLLHFLSTKQYCNNGGIIAYTDPSVLDEMKEIVGDK